MPRKRAKKAKSVSEQLRGLIAKCGMSRYRIAQETGIEQSVLSRFMAGKKGLSTMTLDKLSELLDLEIVMHGPRRVQ